MAFSTASSTATMPVAILATRYSESYDLLHAGFAIPVAVVLGIYFFLREPDAATFAPLAALAPSRGPDAPEAAADRLSVAPAQVPAATASQIQQLEQYLAAQRLAQREVPDAVQDLDEMLGSAVMSEIFYRQGIPTERCLAVIGFPDTSAIGVRTAPNLIRPAHMFRYLKQGRHEELKASVDYFIDREIENEEFVGSPQAQRRYWARSHLGWQRMGRAVPNDGHRALATLEDAKTKTDEMLAEIQKQMDDANKDTVRQAYEKIKADQEEINTETVKIDSSPRLPDGTLKREDAVRLNKLPPREGGLHDRVDRQVRRRGQQVDALREHRAPRRLGRLHAGAEERQRGLEQDRVRGEDRRP